MGARTLAWFFEASFFSTFLIFLSVLILKKKTGFKFHGFLLLGVIALPPIMMVFFMKGGVNWLLSSLAAANLLFCALGHGFNLAEPKNYRRERMSFRFFNVAACFNAVIAVINYFPVSVKCIVRDVWSIMSIGLMMIPIAFVTYVNFLFIKNIWTKEK